MSYGLYLSNGTDGAVITNSNNIFNEELDFELSNESLSAGSALNIQTSGAGNPFFIGIDLQMVEGQSDIQITRDLANDRLVITNTGATTRTFSAKLYRFS